MKILVICQYYYPENFIITKFAEQFVKDGYEVHILTGKPNYGYGYILPAYKNINEEIINGVNVHRVNIIPRKKSRFSIINNYLSFWKLSKKWVSKTNIKFDCVYSMSLSPVTICSAGNLYSKKHDVPHIIHCLDLWPESVLVTKAVKEKSLTYKALYHWSRSIYKNSSKILVSSPSFVEYFDKVLRLPTDDISFIPQSSLIEDSDIIPYEYGKGTHILYCGNLGLIQLIPLITAAMDKLRDQDIYFHIIGMGPMTDFLINDIRERRLGDKVIYHGPIIAKHAASYFKNADAIYISLKGEGSVGRTIPSKLQMSMAFGRPIIGVLKGDGRDVISASGGGFLAEENSDSVRDAIMAIHNLTPKEKERLGALNRRYYETHFSLREVTSLIEKNFTK